ncbi:DUF3916 domain-containing protein [Photorhabdus luminescens subsp. sonorensis]|uniref:DUF3916 domain-containing protein n=1 Tax=Photorhabdus luminescens subsp. sonorensis TaxID=1173677 RepID=A0A5C4RFF1_PHOLU|nr:DUF3916 domain-containing protein [Photorhabdus luminescens subsp. sonorensis]
MCIFISEEYFNEHTRNGYSRFGKIILLSERSLCKEWNLRLPDGFSELGALRISEDDGGKPYYFEYWYYW